MGIWTTAGRWLLVRPLLAAGVALCIELAGRGSRNPGHGFDPGLGSALLLRTGALAAALGLLASFSLTGHAATSDQAPVAVLADLVHLVAASAWYGGLLGLLGGIGIVPVAVAGSEHEPQGGVQDPAFVGRLVARFSNLGLLTMGVLALTGALLGALRLYGPAGLVEHPYGLRLVAKLVFVAGVLALAAINLFLIRPALTRPAEGSGPDPAHHQAGIGRLFRVLVAGEVVLGLGVMAWAASLTIQAPPAGEPARAAVTLDDGWIDPPTLEVQAGRPVLLTVTNLGSTVHTYTVRNVLYEMLMEDLGDAFLGRDLIHGHGDMDIVVRPGEGKQVLFIPQRPGRYLAHCTLPRHSHGPGPGAMVVASR